MANDESTGRRSDWEGAMESRRVMSLEEYRRHYAIELNVQQQQRRRMEQEVVGSNNADGGGHEAARQTGAFSSEEQQRERVRGPVPRERPPQENAGNRFQIDRNFLAQCAQVIGRALLTTLLVFKSLTLYYVMLVLGFYLMYLLLRTLLTSIRVEREEARESQGMRSDTVAKSSHRGRRVSPAQKALYIVTRCITSFVLSIFPTYSVEQLEAELARDGIVTPHLHQD